MEKSNFIDIERVIASKSPRLLRLLPGFAVRYLKRIIHQDEINGFLAKHGDKQGIEFIEEILRMMNVTYTAEGLENINPDGRYIFASNHPLGGLDGIVLIHALGQIFPEVKFPVNDLLMHLTQLHPVFIPVNKHGVQLPQNVRLLDSAYASSAQVLYFPAGLCSRRRNGKIEDPEWKKSFIAKAVKHRRSVVPVYFDGRNSNFFYNLARLRTSLGIGVNIEMLYLVDEMFRQKGRSLTVRIGQPIPYATFDKSRSAGEWAAWVKSTVYSMQPKGANPNPISERKQER